MDKVFDLFIDLMTLSPKVTGTDASLSYSKVAGMVCCSLMNFIIMPNGLTVLTMQFGRKLMEMRPGFEKLRKGFDSYFAQDDSRLEINNSVLSCLLICANICQDQSLFMELLLKILEQAKDHYTKVENKKDKFEHWDHFLKVASLLAQCPMDLTSQSKIISEILQQSQDKYIEYVKNMKPEILNGPYRLIIGMTCSQISLCWTRLNDQGNATKFLEHAEI